MDRYVMTRVALILGRTPPASFTQAYTDAPPVTLVNIYHAQLVHLVPGDVYDLAASRDGWVLRQDPRMHLPTSAPGQLSMPPWHKCSTLQQVDQVPDDVYGLALYALDRSCAKNRATGAYNFNLGTSPFTTSRTKHQLIHNAAQRIIRRLDEYVHEVKTSVVVDVHIAISGSPSWNQAPACTHRNAANDQALG